MKERRSLAAPRRRHGRRKGKRPQTMLGLRNLINVVK